MARLSEIRVVYEREMRDALRDRRTLYAMVLLPMLIYPLLVSLSSHVWKSQERRLHDAVLQIGVEGDLERLRSMASGDPTLRFQALPEASVAEGRADLWVYVPESLEVLPAASPVKVVFDGSDERSQLARDRMEGLLDSLRTYVLVQIAEAAGAAPDPILFAPVEERNVASPVRMTGARMGSLVPFLLILFLFSSGSYAALDAFAGERERGTLEPLLATGADRRNIVAGKFLAVLTVNLGAAVLNLSSLILTLSLTGPEFGAESGLRPTLSAWSVPTLILLAFPLAVLATSILIVIAASAKNFREGQYLTFPVLMAAIVPAMAGNFPGIEDVWAVYFIPIANVAVVARQVLLGEFDPSRILLALGITALFAVVMMRRAAGVLSEETAVVVSGVESPVAAESASRVRAIFFFIAVDFLLFFHVGILLQSRALFPGLVISLVGLLLLPSIVFLKILGLPVGRTASLRAPEPKAFLAALLCAPALILLASGTFTLVSKFLPAPEEYLRLFSELADKERRGGLATYLVLALSPGVCEEFLFRGVVYGILSREWGSGRAVVVSGLLFALFHLSVFRFLPVLLVGLAAGAVVWRTGSLFPAMLLHTAYNALGLALAREEVPALPDAAQIAIAIVCGAAGVLLFARVKPAGAPPPENRSGNPEFGLPAPFSP